MDPVQYPGCIKCFAKEVCKNDLLNFGRLHFFFPDSRLALDLNTDKTLKVRFHGWAVCVARACMEYMWCTLGMGSMVWHADVRGTCGAPQACCSTCGTQMYAVHVVHPSHAAVRVARRMYAVHVVHPRHAAVRVARTWMRYMRCTPRTCSSWCRHVRAVHVLHPVRPYAAYIHIRAFGPNDRLGYPPRRPHSP